MFLFLDINIVSFLTNIFFLFFLVSSTQILFLSCFLLLIGIIFCFDLLSNIILISEYMIFIYNTAYTFQINETHCSLVYFLICKQDVGHWKNFLLLHSVGGRLKTI